MKTPTKKAAASTAAKRNNLLKLSYRKTVPLSNTKSKLSAEIRNLFCLLGNPFLSPDERATCELLFRSTFYKLVVLQNGAVRLPHRISGKGMAV